MFHRLNFAKMSAGVLLPFVVFVALGVVSCGDKKQESPPPDLSKFSGIYDSYLKACAECHEPGNIGYTQKVTNLDMSSAEAAYKSLLLPVQVKRQLGADCVARKYVEAGSPQTSYLYAIMDNTTREAFAIGKNSLCTPLLHVAEKDSAGNNVGGVANAPSAQQKEAIRAWIEKGAPQN